MSLEIKVLLLDIRKGKSIIGVSSGIKGKVWSVCRVAAPTGFTFAEAQHVEI